MHLFLDDSEGRIPVLHLVGFVEGVGGGQQVVGVNATALVERVPHDGREVEQTRLKNTAERRYVRTLR